nr:MAG TPA: hypothetical protein [Caudoviricetes sp.]
MSCTRKRELVFSVGSDERGVGKVIDYAVFGLHVHLLRMGVGDVWKR